MQGTSILTETLKELRNGRRRIIHQGGQYSGKTVNILGALAIDAAEDTEGGVTTITAQSFPHLKGGALRDFETWVYPSFKNDIRKYHKTDHLFSFKSGYLLEFKVFETEMSARGQKRKKLFINEANSFPQNIWEQLDSRSDQSIIDYNPSIRFWAHDNLIGYEENKLFVSDHRHNPFLSLNKHAEIENYYNPLLPEGGERFKVYSRGLTGNITGVIFPNWEMVDDLDFPRDQDWIYSIDYGYTVDPTAIMKQCRIGQTIFIKELGYETGLSPNSIKSILVADGFGQEDVLYSEHDPDMIKALRNLNMKVAPARKGKGSVSAGIELLNQYKVKYSSSSQNLKRELSLYVWETERDTGKSINVPIDKNNHAIDATRYGAYTKYLRTGN